VCLEKREEMPAWKYEIDEAMEEGVKIVNSWGPKRFVEKGGKIAGIEFKRCTSVFDEKGAFNPTYDEKVLTVMDTEGAIVAIGQAGDLSFAQSENVAVTRRGGLDADAVTLQTPLAGSLPEETPCTVPSPWWKRSLAERMRQRASIDTSTAATCGSTGPRTGPMRNPTSPGSRKTKESP